MKILSNPTVFEATSSSTTDEVKNFLYSCDLNLIGMFKRASLYNAKGIKEVTKYYSDKSFEDKVCEIRYSQRFENGKLVGRNKDFVFFNQDGEVGLSFIKEEVLEPDAVELVLRSARFRALNKLIDGVKDTPLEQYISIIYNNYSSEIQSYKDGGTRTFFDAIDNETNQSILDVLDIVVPTGGFQGMSIRSILFYVIT